MVKKRISKCSAIQRTEKCSRSGEVYRLYSEEDFEVMSRLTSMTSYFCYSVTKYSSAMVAGIASRGLIMENSVLKNVVKR